MAVVLAVVLAVTSVTVGTVELDERERVWSAAQFAVVDLAFNLTVFREEVTVWMLLRLILLLAAKYFHELFDARMDNVSPGRPQAATSASCRARVSQRR